MLENFLRYASIALRPASISLLTAPAVSQFTPPSSPPLLLEAPPAAVWQNGAGPTLRWDTIYRDASCRVVDSVVMFEWRYATPQIPSLTNLKDNTSELFSCSYWPTYALPVDKFHMCVAGKARNADTILEYWTFADHNAIGTPAPSVVTINSTNGGQPAYRWILPPRVQTDQIMRFASTGSQGLIRGLLMSLKSSSQVYVYFQTSRELALVDFVAGTTTVQASPVETANAIQVPALNTDYQSYWAVEYAQKGYCYFFKRDTKLPDGTLPLILVLTDTDRDGKVDTSQLITGAQWTNQGWGNVANLVPNPHF